MILYTSLFHISFFLHCSSSCLPNTTQYSAHSIFCGNTHTVTPSPTEICFSFLRRLVSRSQTVDTLAVSVVLHGQEPNLVFTGEVASLFMMFGCLKSCVLNICYVCAAAVWISPILKMLWIVGCWFCPVPSDLWP